MNLFSQMINLAKSSIQSGSPYQRRKRLFACAFVFVLAANLSGAQAQTSNLTLAEVGDCEEDNVVTFVQAGEQPGSFLIPGSDTSVKIGGFVKADFIHDFDAIGSTDFFDTTTIPTDGSSGQNSRIHARQTRLNLNTQRPTDFGEAKVFVEGDFFGDGSHFRLRHGYAQVGGLTIGQTWTAFMDTSILPDLVDFESPTGELLNRRGLAKYTHHPSAFHGLSYTFGIEDSSPRFSSINGTIENDLPDVVGNIRLERERWHFQFASFVNRANFTPLVGTPSEATAYGFNFTGSLALRESSRIKYQYAFGDGIERFRGAKSYELDGAGDLFAIPAIGWYVGFEHEWNPRWKSVVAYSQAELDLPTGLAAGQIESAEYLAANLLWSPSKSTRIGLEYLYGMRTDQDGSFGQANRVQMGIWFYLP